MEVQQSIFYEESTEEEPKEKDIVGNRLSVSDMERVVPLFEAFRELIDGGSDEYTALQVLELIGKEKKDLTVSEARDSARASFCGIQLHNLQYFTSLFLRVSNLNRSVEKDDIYRTFGFQKKEYRDALLRIVEIAKEDDNITPRGLWDTWRMNGHDFTISKGVSTLLPPTETQILWESGLKERDIKEFFDNAGKIDRERLDPHRTLLMNEVMCITNYSFSESAMQVPLFYDEIVIPRDYPNSPISIIDYKTGKEFKTPGKVEKVQMFLMMGSVLANIVDKIGSAQWPGQSDWDLVHNHYSLPQITEKHLRGFPVGSLSSGDFLFAREYLNKNIEFKYINPLTQESTMFKGKDIGIDTEEGMATMIGYLNDLNLFYFKYKEILASILKKKRRYKPYISPRFSYDGFDRGNKGGGDYQSALF